MKIVPIIALVALTVPMLAATRVPATHVVVYHEQGRFAAWPANNGIWSWGDEILVAFMHGWFQDKADSHSIDRERPGKVALARSMDGGRTWKLEQPSTALHPGDADNPAPSPGGIDFSHPDFAMRIRNNAFHFSYDRGRTWKGPYGLPDFGHGALTARTDYLVKSRDECLFFLSSKDTRVQVGGEELQDRAFCARTTDGGKTFQFQSWMSEEPLNVRAVMPATVRTEDGVLVTALRRRLDLATSYRNDLNWIDAFRSEDDGRSWKFAARLGYTDNTLHNGNPPSLTRLPDGRIAAAWGVRTPPFGIHARVRSDGGLTWGPELVLRDDARKYDLGYARSVARADGKVVTVYYYTTHEQPSTHIAATIWTPPSQ